MDDKNEQIYSQYTFNIKNVHKNKGIVYLDTSEGYYMIKPYNYTEYKISAENKVKNMLEEKGYRYTDVCMKNKAGNCISHNKYMNKYIVKRWFKGEECEATNIDDMCKASANLARIHKLMQGMAPVEVEKLSLINDETSFGENKKEANAENKIEEIKETKIEETKIVERNLLVEYRNQMNELKRVNKYLYNKKKKNRLEIEIIKSLDKYYKEGEKYLEQLQKSAYEKLFKEAKEKMKICHGGYTHHGVILIPSREEVATVNFDKMHIGVQIYDLYTLLRKTMEKNDWDIEQARTIIKAYDRERRITDEEKQILKILLGYPEKYRKLINSYYNGKKSCLHIRIYEKLNEYIATEKIRQNFLNQLTF